MLRTNTRASAAQIEDLWRELGRSIAYGVMWLMSMPRVVLGAGANDFAVATLVWSTLALLTLARAPKIPCARVLRNGTSRRWRSS